MLVKDMMAPEGRVYLKSEFDQIGDWWPCFSFTKGSVGRRLQAEFRPGRDIVLYVGTTHPERTQNPDHRSRIISGISIEPNQVLETRKLVPEDVWLQSVEKYGEGSWPYSMAVVDAANMIGPPFPEARSVAPSAYSRLGAMENRGSVVEVVGDERSAAMALPVARIELHLTEPVRRYMRLMGAVSESVDTAVKRESARMADLILSRVARGGASGLRLYPNRSAPNYSDLVAMLIRKWADQGGKCALCDGPLVATGNAMLQASADRIDSTVDAYDEENMQITHLACNFAKNKWTAEGFNDWLAIVRQVPRLN